MARLTISKIIGLSAIISATALVVSVVLPPLFSWSAKYTLKGFPFKFYMPGNFDYGSSFYPIAFLTDFLIIALLLIVGLLFIRRLLRNRVS